MPYEELPVGKIDPNPFQPRQSYDEDALTGLATSAMDELGIRNAPLVRLHPTEKGRYQIASGHGRIEAWKLLGKHTIICRVETLTNSQMKKEVLVENVNRSDLTYEERYTALDAYRLDPDIIDKKDKKKLIEQKYGWVALLSKVSGVSEITIRRVYDVKEMTELVKVRHGSDLDLSKISPRVIRGTEGLKTEERIALILYAADEGLSGDATRGVRIAVQKMPDEIRVNVLTKRDLTQKVIIELAELEDEPDKLIAVYEELQKREMTQRQQLNLIKRVIAGEDITLEVKVIDDAQDLINELIYIKRTIDGWGINQRMILGTRWVEALDLFNAIIQKIEELKVVFIEPDNTTE